MTCIIKEIHKLQSIAIFLFKVINTFHLNRINTFYGHISDSCLWYF